MPKFIQTYQKVKSRAKQTGLVVMGALLSSPVFADLPKMEDPSRGAGKGIMETIKNYAYDGAILGGLLIAAFAFLRVASSCVSTYGEISSGKKNWGDLAMQALVGAVLLVVIIWLITKSADIL
ncbi:TIGR03745 family integrating conjugative element membrane protein [Gallibacterium sp. AGMB14963]|uniref:TIGR03745 family integrating conjugative element membrane protein n=1 Tax=Gallibacterium faecale TaxID=3019086 RepID=UPI0022F1CC61|nr:TIGR03745 family integrating conjugative element membrane protein [Gallibacterium sp. AGMB14963]MDA3978085.1 TIGR03745 family integrating conjugative element membrane protein [Gallibacterium sp. AGMB14963]